MQIREITSIDTLRACENIERRVWNVPDLEVMPASHLAATVHAGGLIAAAFDEETITGLVYGFIARRPEHAPRPYGLHSHLLAVLPEYRGRGIGMKLKHFQRSWCLAKGLPWITWTFDPLQAKNARLNLTHLRATATHYIVDAYGQLGGTLNADLPTDRLVAFWDLHAKVEQTTPSSFSTLPAALEATHHQEPHIIDLNGNPEALRIEIPHNITSILATEPDKALRWRLASRDTFMHYLSRGYTTTTFNDNTYVLERQPSQPSTQQAAAHQTRAR